jgi:glycosyltransferase involved in cell wall biosynthesis
VTLKVADADALRLVSVIMTVYNGERYLREAIESVLQQTYSPIEVIVLDDGSDDASPLIASSYGEDIVHIRRDRAGMGAARNDALGHATGSLLAFLDADDRFVPDKTERQVAALREDRSLEVVYGHVREFVSPDLPPDAASRLRAPAPRLPGRLPGEMLIRTDSFFKVGLFSTRLKLGVGLDWSARAAEAGLRSKMLQEIVYERRLHTTNNALREQASRDHYLFAVKAALDRRRGGQGESSRRAP